MDQDRAADLGEAFAEFWQAPVVERLDTVLALEPDSPHRWSDSWAHGGQSAPSPISRVDPRMTAEGPPLGATSDGVLIELTATVRGTEAEPPFLGSRSTVRPQRGRLATERSHLLRFLATGVGPSTTSPNMAWVHAQPHQTDAPLSLATPGRGMTDWPEGEQTSASGKGSGQPHADSGFRGSSPVKSERTGRRPRCSDHARKRNIAVVLGEAPRARRHGAPPSACEARLRVARSLSPRSSMTSTPRRIWSPTITTSAPLVAWSRRRSSLRFRSCGSDEDTGFVDRLGVDVPRWIETAAPREDTLEASYESCRYGRRADRICRRVGVPFGVSVESVSIRQVEIDASVRLATRPPGEATSLIRTTRIAGQASHPATPRCSAATRRDAVRKPAAASDELRERGTTDHRLTLAQLGIVEAMSRRSPSRSSSIQVPRRGLARLRLGEASVMVPSRAEHPIQDVSGQTISPSSKSGWSKSSAGSSVIPIRSMAAQTASSWCW